MTNERRRRLIKIIRKHLDSAQQGQTPTAHLVVATSLLVELVEEVALCAEGEGDGKE